MIKIMFRRLPVAIVLVVLLVGMLPQPSMAAATADTTRATLLLQIDRLLKEVARLQALLDARSAPLDAATYAPYQSVFFPLNFESIYLVRDGSLDIIEGRRQSEVADQQLFNLFSDIIGDDAVDAYVREWRIFENRSTDLGAFVELIAGTDDWVVGVNRENFDQNEPQIIEAYANLFVHEYAHIILYDQPEMETAFSDRFWTAADYRHATAVERASGDNRFALLRRYYDTNQNRFVGDYATMNVDEDMAETFVAFVRNAKPEGTTLKDRKVRFFYEYDDFVELRTELRGRLAALGAL